MKNRLLLFSLMVLPALLLISEIILKHARGEYFLFDNYDGQYGYLLASLNIAQLYKPGYTQHPGIVPQIIMALVIKFTHMFQGNDVNMVIDTFTRPEFYLQKINIAYTLLNVIGLYILGLVAYKKIGNIFAAIFIQLTPFISVMNIYEITLSIPESILIFLNSILLAITISYLNDIEITPRKNLIYIYLFGIVCGLALATKISVLPILLIPFLLVKKIKYKLLFVLISIVTFFILFLTISPEGSTLWKFIFNNIVHSGKYGEGSANFVDTKDIMPKLMLLYNEFFFFCIIFVLIFITLLLQFIPKFKIRIRTNKYFLLLTGVFIIMSCFIILVIKQKEGYYVMPGLLLSVIGLFAVNSIFTDLFPQFFRRNKYLYVFIFFILFSIPQIKSFKSYTSFFNTRRMESYKIVKYLNDNYPNTFLVASDRASSMPTAFSNGLNYTGGLTDTYLEILADMYPNYAYFQKWRKEFIYLDYNEDIKKRLLNSDTIVFHSFDESNFKDFKEKIPVITAKKDITFNEVFANKNGEKLYLVSLK